MLSPRSVAYIHTQEAAALLIDRGVCQQRTDAAQLTFSWLKEVGLRGFWKKVAGVTSEEAARTSREVAFDGVDAAEQALLAAGEQGGGAAGEDRGEELLGGMFAPLPLNEDNPSTKATDVLLDKADEVQRRQGASLLQLGGASPPGGGQQGGAAASGEAEGFGVRQLAASVRQDPRTAAAVDGASQRLGGGGQAGTGTLGKGDAEGEGALDAESVSRASVGGMKGRERDGAPLHAGGMDAGALRQDVAEPRLRGDPGEAGGARSGAGAREDGASIGGDTLASRGLEPSAADGVQESIDRAREFYAGLPGKVGAKE